MKTSIKTSLAFAAALLFASISHADTRTADFVVSGSFGATCSFVSPSFPIGSMDLSKKLINGESPQDTVNIPSTLSVVCNDQTAPWFVYHAAASYPLAIGSVADNKVCLASNQNNDPSFEASDRRCVVGGIDSNSRVSGAGTSTAPVVMVIWNDTGTRTAYKGTGLMTGTIPLIIEF